MDTIKDITFTERYWIDCTWAYWLSRKLWKSHSNIIEEW